MNESQEDVVRKRRQLSPEEKYQIFIEATMAKAKGNGSIAEVLRRWGIHATDLNRIRKAVEEGAISTFRARKSRKPKVDHAEHQRLKAEKDRLEATVLEQAAELALLKKKDRSG
jgi:transposase-like protein